MIHMKILLSNDDGVDASGILAAKKVADEFGETYVVAQLMWWLQPSSKVESVMH